MADVLEKINAIKEAIDGLKDKTVILTYETGEIEKQIAKNIKNDRSPIPEALNK